MTSFGFGKQLRIVALAALLQSAAAIAQEPADQRALLVLCTDDDEGALAVLAEEVRSASRFVELAPAPRCAGASPAPVAPRFWGSFETDADGRIVLGISSGAKPEEKRSSRVPWLASPERPIAATIGMDKTSALALIIDGLVLDLRSLSLSALPVTQPAATESRRDADSAPAPPPVSPVATPRAEVEWGLELGAGAAYLSPDAAAPCVELGGSLGTGRWRAVASAHAELDSNFEIGARSFSTFSAGARLGARYIFFRGTRLRLGVELAAAWRQNRYRRDDIAGTEARTWADFGASVGIFGRARLAGPLGVFLLVGAAIWPTARVASIAEGPKKRVSLVTVPGVAGFDLDF